MTLRLWRLSHTSDYLARMDRASFCLILLC